MAFPREGQSRGEMSPLVTRRDLLKGAAQVGVGLAASAVALGRAVPSGASRVVLVRDPEVLGTEGQIREEVLGRMLDQGLQALLGIEDARAAWASLVRPEETVGIKSNVWHYLPTPKELENAIGRRLVEIGVSRERLAVDDRGVVGNPVFQKATSLVNVRPLRTHFWAGIGGCIKNYIMFVPDPSSYHPDGCAHLGAIWHKPMVRGKTRLNVLCALTPQFYGRGPHFFDRRYLWPYCGLILGRDPVSVDAVGARLLAAKRLEHFGEERPLDVTPHHIEVADRIYGLGTSDLSRVELLHLGWSEEALL